jgi:hypothetical protein
MDARAARSPWLVAAAVAVALIASACAEEGKADSENLADEVSAERCVAPPGSTGGIYTCEFDGGPKRCYEVDWVPDRSLLPDQRELEFQITLRHVGACTAEDKPSPPR